MWLGPPLKRAESLRHSFLTNFIRSGAKVTIRCLGLNQFRFLPCCRRCCDSSFEHCTEIPIRDTTHVRIGRRKRPFRPAPTHTQSDREDAMRSQILRHIVSSCRYSFGCDLLVLCRRWCSWNKPLCSVQLHGFPSLSDMPSR